MGKILVIGALGNVGAEVTKRLLKSGEDIRTADLSDYWQAAQILSEVLDRKITYRNPSLFLFLLSHLQRGTPFMFALVMTGLYLSTRNGMARQVTQEVERITGKKPKTFRQYVQDHKIEWI